LVLFGFFGVEGLGFDVETLLERVSVLRSAHVGGVPCLGGDELAIVAFREYGAVVAQRFFQLGRDVPRLLAGHRPTRFGKGVNDSREAHLDWRVDAMQNMLALYNVKSARRQLLFFFCSLERYLRL
jgi:hypothetical protein